ncbi:MAG TPA: anthranilate synthase component I [Candidatus Omnitrophica bacterium]|nr:anthranilate synthase component I [Candidatus Omnitrophota bacterium]
MNLKVNLNLEKFLDYSNKFNIIGLSLELGEDFITPIQLYLKIRNKDYSFLLESVEGEEKISRFSFVGFLPLYLFQSQGENIKIRDFLKKKTTIFKTSADPLQDLKDFMSKFRVFLDRKARFEGGFVGYLGYDNIRFFEPVLNTDSKISYAQSMFIFCKYLFIFDHKEKRLHLTSFVVLPSKIKKDGLKKIYKKEKEKILNLIKFLSQKESIPPVSFKRKRLNYRSNFSKKEFIQAVKKAKQYIRKGDVIQVVLSQKLTVKFSKEAFNIYRQLRILNPSPYMYYLNFKDLKIIGSSPEMLLRCENKVLINRPIAGTRPRGKTEKEDLKLEKELLADPKEKAEHIMLVDLGRNDLGRVSKKGTVHLPVFMKVERFSHVMHLVSEVRAVLDKGKDSFSALRACFPAGTLTGAPKIRAMQIIDELEKEPRKIYGGCVGYFSFTGNLDTAIIIRTIILKDNKGYIQAGAGIVLDSDPQREYLETLNKAKAQLLALELASGN